MASTRTEYPDLLKHAAEFVACTRDCIGHLRQSSRADATRINASLAAIDDSWSTLVRAGTSIALGPMPESATVPDHWATD